MKKRDSVNSTHLLRLSLDILSILLRLSRDSLKTKQRTTDSSLTDAMKLNDFTE